MVTKPFLVVDSYSLAEIGLRADYGLRIADFHVIHTPEGLLGIEGDVYSFMTWPESREGDLIRSALNHRVLAGRITDHGRPR